MLMTVFFFGILVNGKLHVAPFSFWESEYICSQVEAFRQHDCADFQPTQEDVPSVNCVIQCLKDGKYSVQTLFVRAPVNIMNFFTN
jgi:hypothetical protein